MPRKKSKRGSVALGFVLTVGILSLLTFVLLESGSGQGVTVATIPDKLPPYSGVLQRYVPSDALQVSFDNLTAIRAVNQSILSTQEFFELDRPHVSMNTTAIAWRLTVGLSTPNATVTIAALNSGSFGNLAAALAGAGDAVLTDKVGNMTVYAATGTLAGVPQAYWLALLPGDRTLVYSSGANSAFQALGGIISVYHGAAPSILNRTDVDRMVYAVNGTEGHLALGIQNFAGSVRTSNATLISVDAGQSAAQISYVVRFTDANEASSQVDAVKSAYISAHQFFQYDELVKAVEVQPISQLKVAVGLVG